MKVFRMKLLYLINLSLIGKAPIGLFGIIGNYQFPVTITESS